MKYFQLSDDMLILDRWEFGDLIDGNGEELWHTQFTRGILLSIQLPARACMYVPGRALDFSTTALCVPIIHARVKVLLEQLGLHQQLQFIPITVEGESDPYYIMNLLRIIRCIDEAKCEEVGHRTVEEGYEDGIGEYYKMSGMRIDPSQVEETEIFRPWGWQITFIVSERVKHALEEARITGTCFTEV